MGKHSKDAPKKIKMNIYFIHAKYIKERETVIENFKDVTKKYKFRNVSIRDIHIIEDFDPADIDINTVRQYVNYDKIQENHVEVYNQFLKNMHINQLSNALKHYKAMELIAKNSHDGELNMILEDDILYEEKICYSLDKLVSKLPEKYDILFLGMPKNQPIDPSQNSFDFHPTKNTFPVIPFCDSYLISHSACKAMVPHYMPIKFINNIQMSYVCDKVGLNTSHCLPNIFVDGSKYGMFLSKLSNNNPLIFNSDFTTLRSLISKDVLEKEDIKNIETLLNKTPIRSNPDFAHLECIYHIKCQEYQKAKDKFDEAYKVYALNGCVLGHDSVFLRDYIRVHKHLQSDVV